MPQTRIPRVASVDLLRGLVMVMMALDHTRDFVHAGAMNLRPDDLTTTTAAIFAPAGSRISARRVHAVRRPRRSGCACSVAATGALARLLVSRGLWLVVLEFTIVRLVFFLELHPPLVFLLVFWSIGVSMIALAALIYLPRARARGLRRRDDRAPQSDRKLTPEQFGAWAPLWRVLHQQGLLVPGPPAVIVAYPLIPWIGVMVLGFCLGEVYRLPPDRRRRLLIGAGLAMVAAFVSSAS